ncbi:MAG: TIGR03936 family radical SAM-associated protein [Chloroflexota bacterium]
MDERSGQPPGSAEVAAAPIAVAPREPRQRWRVTFRRGSGAPAVTHREVADTWMASLAEAGLPLLHAEGSKRRPPLTFAAPLPLGMPVEADLADLFLAERCLAWDVRDRVSAAGPDGIDVVALHDVWLGAPALSAVAAAADYRVELEGDAPAGVAPAAQALLAAPSIPRRRQKGNGTVEYDLRPLVDSIDLDRVGGTAVLRVRTRFHPERGSGRPEEVVAALGDVLGRPLAVTGTVRERILTIDEIEATEPEIRGSRR